MISEALLDGLVEDFFPNNILESIFLLLVQVTTNGTVVPLAGRL